MYILCLRMHSRFSRNRSGRCRKKEVVMADWNEATIQEFHSKAGKGVGPFGDQLMLLTTVGARSGDERISPVMLHRDGERYVVVASKGGGPDPPGWNPTIK